MWRATIGTSGREQTNLKQRIVRANPALARRARWALAKRSDLTRVAIDELVELGQTVIDVGASDGVFTERLSRLVGPTGRVHAFEANPEDREQLESVRVRCANVVVHMEGLSDREGEALLHVPVIHGQRHLGRASVVVPSSRSDLEHDRVPIQLQRLDDAIAEEQASISLIKCDVEGHEHEMLVGAEQTLRTSRPTLVIEIEQRHRELSVDETFSFLQGLGYGGFAARGNDLFPLADFDLARDQLRWLQTLDEHPEQNAPVEYIHNFVFRPADQTLPAKLLKRLAVL